MNLLIHIELDGGANVSFISEEAASKCGFNIVPNLQISKLGDGKTVLESIGEINETFFRNEWKVKFRALVVKELHTDFVGGTTFMTDNLIDQRFKTRMIEIHDRKYSVMETKKNIFFPLNQ